MQERRGAAVSRVAEGGREKRGEKAKNEQERVGGAANEMNEQVTTALTSSGSHTRRRERMLIKKSHYVTTKNILMVSAV